MMEELAPLPEWLEFGTALEVQRAKLVEIERTYHLWGQRRYNIELFHHWLQWCCDPTWEKIARALEQAGVDDKARAVRAKYCEKSAGKGLLAGFILHRQLLRWLWNVLLDGGERTVQEGQRARTSNAAQHKPASTATSTTNGQPDNSKATPVDAIDSRFAHSTTNRTLLLEEGNLNVHVQSVMKLWM